MTCPLPLAMLTNAAGKHSLIHSLHFKLDSPAVLSYSC